MPEEERTITTRWIFATSKPRTITLGTGGTAPGRWEDGPGGSKEWIEPINFGATQIEFNQYSGLHITNNARNAKLIQSLKAFRSDINPHGNVWLVKKGEVKGFGRAIPATAPAPKPRTHVTRGTRGTSDTATAIKGQKTIKSHG